MKRSAVMLLVLLVGCGGGGDGGGDPPVTNPTAAQLTTSGWAHFAAGDLAAALVDFDAAVTRDAQYAPAHLGRGWARLGLAADTAGLQQAVTSFSTAIDLGTVGADGFAGRAAAQLARGEAAWQLALTDAQAALAIAPAYQFSRRPSFDHRDLRLIEAFALAGLEDHAAALAAASAIAPSPILANDPATWGGFPSFAAAVLAYLQQLSNNHAG